MHTLSLVCISLNMLIASLNMLIIPGFVAPPLSNTQALASSDEPLCTLSPVYMKCIPVMSCATMLHNPYPTPDNHVNIVP